MKFRLVLPLILILCLALLVACGSSLKQDILGKWSGTYYFALGSNASMDFHQIEFLSSRTTILDEYTTDYSFLDDQRINIQAGMIGIALIASIRIIS